MNTPRPPTELAIGGLPGLVGPADVTQVLLDSLPDPIHVVDRDWRLTFANDAFARHMQRDKADVIGASLWDLIPRARGARLEQAYIRVMASGEPDNFLHESVHYPDRTMDVRVFPLFNGVAIVLRDVTRRVIAERALAISEDHLQRALNGAELGHWSWDAETDVMFLSERTLHLYGLGPEHQGMKRTDIRRIAVHPDDAPAVKQAAEDAHVNKSQYETQYRVLRDGEWRWMRVIAGPQIVNGKVVGMHGLVQDIHDLKLADERLRAEIEERERAQQRQTLLIHELNHRVKNILAMVQAIALQTLSTSASPEASRKALEQRLVALASAHDVLTRESWDGAELADIITGVMAAYEARVRPKGPKVRLEPKAAVSLAMTLHELATNAVKYGALSRDQGWVGLDWKATPAAAGLDLRITWTEHGGPPVEPPTRTGFGTRLITRSLSAEQGSAELVYAPEGLICRMALIAKSPAPKSSGVP
jgi:PAS domain S-box-containing protein